MQPPHVTVFSAAPLGPEAEAEGRTRGPSRGAGLHLATSVKQPEPQPKDAAGCRGPSSTRRDGLGELLRHPAVRAAAAAATATAAADDEDAGAWPPDQCAAG